MKCRAVAMVDLHRPSISSPRLIQQIIFKSNNLNYFLNLTHNSGLKYCLHKDLNFRILALTLTLVVVFAPFPRPINATVQDLNIVISQGNNYTVSFFFFSFLLQYLMGCWQSFGFQNLGLSLPSLPFEKTIQFLFVGTKRISVISLYV